MTIAMNYIIPGKMVVGKVDSKLINIQMVLITQATYRKSGKGLKCKWFNETFKNKNHNHILKSKSKIIYAQKG